jgi:prolyl-tRNA editing enzyme YbaK/EbsC (Cys-tRNA(Pro) deacylase)
MTDSLSASAQRVQDALRAQGFINEVMEHEQTTRTARDAAAALGCTVGQIVKSLVFRAAVSGRGVLVEASGVNRVNEARLAGYVGEPLERADPDFVRETTGYAIGGIPPLGHRAAMLTFIDQDLLQYAEIWAAAGTPNAIFRLTPDELVRMTGGQVVEIK